MAVKVCINGQMNKIDTTLHKPVIFINGQKKVLDKAWIFVNGEKKMLWGQPGVQVDLIRSDSVVSGVNALVAIGENWAVTSGNNNINRLNIENLSNPSLIQSVAWGTRMSSPNGFLSDTSKLIFYGLSSSAYNRLKCDLNTGVVSVEKTYSVPIGIIIGDIGNNALSYGSKTKSWVRPGPSSSSAGMITRTWGSNIYINNSVAYSIGHEPSSASDVNYGPYINGVYFQYSSTAWYINCLGAGNYLSQSGLNSITTSSVSKVNKTITGTVAYLDGNNVVSLGTNLYLLDKTTLVAAYTSEVLTNSSTSAKVIGKNGGYYYVVQYPKTATQNGAVKLYLLNESNLATVYTQDLPSDPFNEYSGVSTFWNNCLRLPHSTGSGFLGVSGNVSGQLRIVRFSQLL